MRRGLIAIMFMSCVCPVPAFADQASDVVQLVCVPDKQYFSADRSYIDDIAPGRDHRSQFFAVAWTENLATKPFVCDWKGHRIQAQAYRYTGMGPKPQRSPCNWNDGYGYGVQVVLDGIGIGCLEEHGQSVSHRTLLTVNADGVSRNGGILVTQCDVDLSPVDDDKKVLTETGNLRCVTDILEQQRKLRQAP